VARWRTCHWDSLTAEEAGPWPIVATMKLLGNQWNMIAVRYLHDKPMKFNQLKRAMGEQGEQVHSSR
jgi:DNA-binding HxlR family transcriptional regulator